MDLKTRCARAGKVPREIGSPLAPVIVPSAVFAFDDQAAVDRHFATGEGFVYSRHGNPTVLTVERLLAQLEGTETALLFSSGMAAISSLVLSRAGAGQRIAAQRDLYGGTSDLFLRFFPDLGIQIEWLEQDEVSRLDPERIRDCRLLFLETPTNPTLRVVDLERAASAARMAGVPVVVDSTFASPILQRPVEHGVDLVVHSATKFLGGHGDLVAGVVAGSSALLAPIDQRRRLLGGTLDAFSAFLLHRGIRTLAVRMEAHCRGAEQVARALSADSRVAQVHFPGMDDHPQREVIERQMSGYGGMVAFRPKGGDAAAVRFHDRLELFARGGSLGCVESLVSIPARMSHRGLDPGERIRAGIPDDLVRLSIGLESPDDLIADIAAALG